MYTHAYLPIIRRKHSLLRMPCVGQYTQTAFYSSGQCLEPAMGDRALGTAALPGSLPGTEGSAGTLSARVGSELTNRTVHCQDVTSSTPPSRTITPTFPCKKDPSFGIKTNISIWEKYFFLLKYAEWGIHKLLEYWGYEHTLTLVNQNRTQLTISEKSMRFFSCHSCTMMQSHWQCKCFIVKWEIKSKMQCELLKPCFKKKHLTVIYETANKIFSGASSYTRLHRRERHNFSPEHPWG